jgi:acetyl esterase/lipase
MKYVISLSFLFIYLFVTPQESPTLFLWPDREDTSTESEPSILPDRGDGVIRLTNVTNPSLTVFEAPENKKNGVAVIVSPGGGFKHLCINKEGSEIAEWLNELGVTAFLLEYRVPDKRDLAARDIQRAMRLVRSTANEWGINPDKLGVIGFSAGGNLSAQVSGIPKNSYEPTDAADTISCIPNFAMLIYPGGMGNANSRTLPENVSFGAGSPPMFIYATADDGIANYGSLNVAEALLELKIPVELHMIPEGGHGYGMRSNYSAARVWPELAEKWLCKYILTNQN